MLGQGTPGEVLEGTLLERAYGAPFCVRWEKESIQVAACPERDAKREELVKKILENREEL